MYKLVPFYGLKLAQVEKFLYLCSRKGILNYGKRQTCLSTIEESADHSRATDGISGLDGSIREPH
jgi:hypothetical protein